MQKDFEAQVWVFANPEKYTIFSNSIIKIMK